MVSREVHGLGGRRRDRTAGPGRDRDRRVVDESSVGRVLMRCGNGRPRFLVPDPVPFPDVAYCIAQQYI